MSVQNAMQFIQRLRKDEALKEKISDHNTGPTLDQFVTVGAEVGFVFTLDDLVTAHKHDWAMRWLLHSPQSATMSIKGNA